MIVKMANTCPTKLGCRFTHWSIRKLANRTGPATTQTPPCASMLLHGGGAQATRTWATPAVSAVAGMKISSL